MDSGHGTEEVLQEVDFVDEVVEYDAAAGGFTGPPVVLRVGEVCSRFEGGPEAGDGSDITEDTGGEDLL